MQQETPQPSQPASLPPVTSSTPPQPSSHQEDEGEHFYQPASSAPLAAQAASTHAATTAHQSISWEASEYIHNDKGGMWLVGLGIITFVCAAIALFLQAWTFVALIVVMGVAMGIFAFRKPHILAYTLDNEGVEIDGRLFRYSEFRAFGILQEGAFYTMTLIPVKRFAPSMSVYFAEEQGEDIVDIVGQHLPMEHVEPDYIDLLMRRLRF